MNENLISFKGNEDGIYIHIKDGNFKTIKEQLDIKLNKIGKFFAGSNVINFKGRDLTTAEKDELKGIIEKKYGIAVKDDTIVKSQKNNENSKKDKLYFEGIHEGNTKFVKATIRSGQRIEYDGNVVILGDVNPGGQIIARGNILVMGALRGIAHAGSDGNKDAIVSAFILNPTQLRIADIIARSPDNDVTSSKWPEVAKIEGDSLLVEPYLPKK